MQATEGQVNFKPRTDPVTFEVLRHRLWQINDEQGQTILNVSGSPVAYESNDFNIVIADAEGEIVCVGPYIIAHMSALSLIIKNALEMFGKENIEPDTMYLVNDPWFGAAHQNDVCIIAPVHWDGKLIAWTGSTIHQVDVGGPTFGSWNPDAQDTFQEAPRWRLLKIVRNGEVQPEVLDTYLTHSRTPKLVELDTRAQIAAANVAKARLYEVCRRYSVDTVLDTMRDMLDYSELMLRRRLSEIPDGTWYAESYMDHDGHEDKIYTCRVRLTKQGNELTFDYRDSDPQSPGFVNSAYTGVFGSTFTVMLTYLCGDIPWNSGIMRPVRILSKEGSIHHARFPAPVGSGVVNAAWQVMNGASIALSKMLLCSEAHRTRAMAVWAGSTFVFNVHGETLTGESFGTMMLNSPLQGDGARTFADGYDIGGQLSAPRPSVSNVESLEEGYPVLTLYRKRAVDSGGPGKYRGGVSAESAITPYGADEIHVRVTTFGSDQSCTEGIAGGYPGAGANPILVRNTTIMEDIASGNVLVDIEELGGQLQVLPPKYTFTLRPGDVFASVPHGGGGFGDPLERDPELVLRDVLEGYVSHEWAEKVYGVVLRGNPPSIDKEMTNSVRDERRKARKEAFKGTVS